MKYTGNVVPEIMKEEHDQILNAKRMSMVSASTIYAVVNTSAVGQSSIVLDTGTNWIGLVTNTIGSAPTLYAVVNTSAQGQASVVLDTGANWIGLATVNVGAALPAGTNNIGDVDIATIAAGDNNIGNVDIASIAAGDNNIGNVDIASIAAGANYIGLATVDIGTAPTLTVDATGQGDVPITLDGEAVVLGAGSAAIGKLAANSGVDIGDVDILSIAAGDNNIGNVDVVTMPEVNALATVTAVNPNTMSHVAIAANTSGLATIFVPSNTFKVTHFLLSANATVGVRIKSGATYLTGNASVNMTLFPGGGMVENGQIGNPVYIGATSGDAFILDLDDSIEVAGKVVYYEE